MSILLLFPMWEPRFENTDHRQLTELCNAARDELEEAAENEPNSAWHRDCWETFCEIRAEVEARGYMSGTEH